MKKRMVWRYWCDFCKKGGCSAGAMKKHEDHCTLNPGRACRVCAGRRRPAPLSVLVEIANAMNGKPEDVAASLSDAADGCPACILAAIRQADRTYDQFNDDRSGESGDRGTIAREGIPFDYKKAKDEFWAEENKDQDGSDFYY